MKKTPTFVDICCGAGGIFLGMEKANFKCVFSCEIDKHACKTYKTNFSEDPKGDITTLDPKTVPDHDILCAGFPCQSFSIFGKHLGFADTRGTIVFYILNIIKEKKPKVVFFENVKGLQFHDKGKTLETIVNALRELGYVVNHKVLNAADFGLAQNRERIYIVAFRKDIKNASSFRFPVGNDRNAKLGDVIEKESVSEKYYLSQGILDYYKNRALTKSDGFCYKINSDDDVVGTLVVGGSGKRHLYIDKRLTDTTTERNIKGGINTEYVRRLTPRECARLQGFPDTFSFPVSMTQAYKQIGNSVPVPVIAAIARNISAVLLFEELQNGQKMYIPRNEKDPLGITTASCEDYDFENYLCFIEKTEEIYRVITKNRHEIFDTTVEVQNYIDTLKTS